MPGIAGFTTGGMSADDAGRVLKEMREYITHRDFHVQDGLFQDGYVCATRTHIAAIQAEPQPRGEAGVQVWMDGEFYNQRELLPGGAGGKTDPEILLSLYAGDGSLGFLRDVDGMFSAVIYDSNRRVLHVMTDRYGLRHLYWKADGGGLAWASEAKAMLALPGFKPHVDRAALAEFLELGYLLEDRTWPEGVSLVPSGSVITYDLEGRSADLRRYWWWDEIKPMQGRVDEDEIAEELGRLIARSVDARSGGAADLGVLLSGGMDSRAIIAALDDGERDLHAVTFGIADSPDVRIARRVAELRGVSHKVVEIDAANWLAPRLEAVWWTEGQTSLLDMHGVEALDEMRGLARIYFNGIDGGAIVGGGYLAYRSFIDNVDRGLVAARLGCRPELLGDFEPYVGLGKADFYFLQNTMRRLTGEGLRMAAAAVESRAPFCDNELVELCLSLPDTVRFRRRMYIKAVLRAYPEYFSRIPWSRTGVPVGWPENAVEAIKRARRGRDKALERLGKYGLRYRINRCYQDYRGWIRQEPARSFFRRLLAAPDPLYAEYIPAERVRNELDRHLQGADRATQLCRYLTVELFLRQLFEKRYRSAGEFEA